MSKAEIFVSSFIIREFSLNVVISIREELRLRFCHGAIVILVEKRETAYRFSAYTRVEITLIKRYSQRKICIILVQLKKYIFVVRIFYVKSLIFSYKHV